jgi:hypothetical protein
MTDNTLNGKPRSLLQLALASPAFLEKDQEQVTTNEKAQTVICLGFLILAEWTAVLGQIQGGRVPPHTVSESGAKPEQ